MIGLQEQVANHRKRLGSKALVVSVAEKASSDVRCESKKANNRELPFNCRNYKNDVETGSLCCPGSAWRVPVYWPCGVRHRGSASAIRAPMLNCRNLRLQCKGKGTSAKREADSTDVQPRDGATRSSDEVTVMVMEQRGRVIASCTAANCESRRSVGA